VRAKAPIDGFGIGTALDTSSDAPYLDAVYKLQEYAGVARRKRSEGKATWPGRKQVFRLRGDDGRLTGDTVSLATERTDGEPLLEPVMRAGKRIGAAQRLEQIRARVVEQLAQLPAPLRGLDAVPVPYRVQISSGLRELAAAVDAATM
jgi:nicotinate phosphoribosyltransferase